MWELIDSITLAYYSSILIDIKYLYDFNNGSPLEKSNKPVISLWFRELLNNIGQIKIFFLLFTYRELIFLIYVY